MIEKYAYKQMETINGRNRVVLLECPTCGKQWNVRNRGRETGFIVAAANNHATRCFFENG